MNTSSAKFKNVDDYIAKASLGVRDILAQIRTTIRTTVPDAIESISYGMPAYKLNGKPLVYFAAFEHHIGFYATPEAHEEFAEELSKYKQGKGSVQFPLDKPIPYKLIATMTAYKAKQIQDMEK